MIQSVPDETDELIGRLRNAISFMSEFAVHEDRLGDAGVDPAGIDSIADFRTVPAMSPKELAEDFDQNPPFGTMIPDDSHIIRCNFTPNPQMDRRMPVPYTRQDLDLNREGTAEAFRRMGVTEDDVVLNTASFAPYPAGWIGAMGIETIGATHLPTGPGDTDEQIDVIDRYNVTTLYGFPSFLQQIAAQAAPGVLDSVERVLCTGEPFTAIEGFRQELIEAYGGDIVATDAYGLAEFRGGLIAYETAAMDGMYIPHERVFVEVIDPETGELVERGEKGELVVTSLVEHSNPVLRMRTGDLTRFDKRDTDGEEYVLQDGVFGRVDDMRKVKGVKLFPTEIQMFLAGIDGIDASNVQFRVSRPQGMTDTFSITVNGDPEIIDREALASDIRSIANVSVDELVLDEDFELDGDVMVDEREGQP